MGWNHPHLLRGRTALALLFAGPLCTFSVQANLTEERQQALHHMLLHDCGSCHGMTLQGGLGLPLTTEALAGKPAEFLFRTIRDGHPGTPMPPWKEILNEEEIYYLVDLLLRGAVQ
ncbi:MAG: cytochrome c [Pseudomonadota bacterium]|nr:cytochrome c [Pseudomonadota bacterium]